MLTEIAMTGRQIGQEMLGSEMFDNLYWIIESMGKPSRPGPHGKDYMGWSHNWPHTKPHAHTLSSIMRFRGVA